MNTVSTTDTAFNSTVLPFSPQKLDIWTALSGRPLRLNWTLTISTEMEALVSVNHGSLLSAPSKLSGHDPGTFGNAFPYP
jgi:hypothetical protein